MTGKILTVVFCATILVAALPIGSRVLDGGRNGAAILLAQESGTTRGELEPRYKPVPPKEESWYNSGYVFALTRGVARSTLHPVVKAPLFALTLPLDVVLVPFTAIGGLFG